MKPRWLMPAGLFILFLLYFMIRHSFYLPAQIEIKGQAPSASKVLLFLDSGAGFNDYEKFDIDIPPSKGEFTRSYSLPQSKIQALRLEGASPATLQINSVTVTWPNGTKVLPVSDPALKQPQLWSPLDLPTKAFHIRLFSVQVATASFAAWIIWLLSGLRQRLGQPNWRATWRWIFLERHHRVFWIMFCTSASTFSLWLFAYWPGWMTNDTWSTLNEITTLLWGDWHPYIYTIYIMSLQQFFNSVAAAGLFQLLATAALGSYIIYYAWRQGVRFAYLAPFFLFFTISLPLGQFNIVLWKDVPFSVLTLAFCFLIYHARVTREATGASPKIPGWMYPFIIVGMAGLLHLRHNGIIYLVLIPALTWFCFDRKQYLRLMGCLVAVWLCVFAIIPKVCNIQMTHHAAYFQFRTALYIMTHHNFYSKDRKNDIRIIEEASGVPWATIEKLFPRNWFQIWDSTRFVKEGLQFTETGGETKEYNKAFVTRLITQNIPVFMATRTFDFFHSIGLDNSNYDYTTNYYENPLQLAGSNLAPPGKFMWGVTVHSKPILPFMTSILNRYGSWSRRYDGLLSPSVAVWNLAIPLGLFILFIFLEGGLSAMGLFIIPFLVLAATVFAAGAGESWRYFYYLYLGGIFVIPLYLAYKKKLGRAKTYAN